MEDLFIFIVAIWGAAIGLWIAYGIIKKKQDAEKAAQPIRKEYVTVVDKQQLDSGGIIIGEPWVLFELENGSRVRLNAHPENSLVVGDAGILTWQGRKIKGFERERRK